MLWIKAFHLIFMVTWFAGLFYLPRLFVYHAMTDDELSIKRFETMERKLFFGIMTPGGILTLIFGIWLLRSYAWETLMTLHWLHVKLAFIALLVAYHVWCGVLLLRFRRRANNHTHAWYRWFNEAPVVALIAIICLAVLKPDLGLGD